MNATVTLDNVLDAAEQLDVETQAELVRILSHRLVEHGRDRVAASIAEALREAEAGGGRVMTAAEIIREAQS